MHAVRKIASLAIVLTGCTTIFSGIPGSATPIATQPDPDSKHAGSSQQTTLQIGRVSVSQKSDGHDESTRLKGQEPSADMPPLAPDRTPTGRYSPLVSAPPVVAPSTTRSDKELILSGTRQFMQGNTVQAENLFRQALTRNPHSVDALFNLGALAERRGDPASALGFYRKALDLKKNDADLQMAVDSLQNQLAGSSTHNLPLHGSAVANNSDVDLMPPMAPQLAKLTKAPLVGSVMSNNAPSFPLYPQQARFAQQTPFAQSQFSVPVQTNRVPELAVHQPPVAQANVSQNWKTAIPMLHVGIGLVPGLRGMSCPVCHMLNSL